jgi:hypothetical protein
MKRNGYRVHTTVKRDGVRGDEYTFYCVCLYNMKRDNIVHVCVEGLYLDVSDHTPVEAMRLHFYKSMKSGYESIKYANVPLQVKDRLRDFFRKNDCPKP